MLPLTPKGQQRGNMLLQFKYSRKSPMCTPTLAGNRSTPDQRDQSEQDGIAHTLTNTGEY